MPQIHRTGQWTAHAFYMDHPPPHFHAHSAGHKVKIEIASLEVLAGDLPRAVLRRVVAWAAENRDYLTQCWVAAENGEEMP